MQGRGGGGGGGTYTGIYPPTKYSNVVLLTCCGSLCMKCIFLGSHYTEVVCNYINSPIFSLQKKSYKQPWYQELSRNGRVKEYTRIVGMNPSILFSTNRVLRHGHGHICYRIWENPACSEFYEILVSCIFDKLYPRANLPPSLRLITRLALELKRFVSDCATHTINEKLLCTRIAFPYTTCEPEIN